MAIVVGWQVRFSIRVRACRPKRRWRYSATNPACKHTKREQKVNYLHPNWIVVFVPEESNPLTGAE